MPREWKPFDYANKATTAPAENALVWVHDVYAPGVTIGWFDGFTMVTFANGDDCNVTHWMALDIPAEPEGL